MVAEERERAKAGASWEATLHARQAPLPFRALRLEVIDGPDKGRFYEANEQTVTIGTAPGNDLVLTDATVSRHHLELSLIADRVMVVDHGSTNGTQAGTVDISRGYIRSKTVLTLGRSRIRVLDGRPIEVRTYDQEDLHGLKGRSEPMRRLMSQVEQVARSNASVLILGETGTGKERVAQALHRASARADKPLEIVDCGALMPTLIASELFGHEKGAFTGANQQHLGAFERAHGGTLFLDELGELPANLQVQLLGALERRSFKRVGGSKPIRVDVRVISATHRDLRARVNSGSFREDLYYRIAVARLTIAPLRERTEDIPLLLEHFLREQGEEAPIDDIVPESMLDTLLQHEWPGNVRELRNFVEAIMAFGGAPPLETHPSTAPAPASLLKPLLELTYRDARDRLMQDFQQAYFTRLLERSDGNVSKAAALARMSRTHLIQMIKQHKIR
ncbi:MAG: sigma 54-interacting transcriptional regulator [Myxococcota bacterium]